MVTKNNKSSRTDNVQVELFKKSEYDLYKYNHGELRQCKIPKKIFVTSHKSLKPSN
jgi:hypothetical protein